MNDASSSTYPLHTGAVRHLARYQDIMVHLDGSEEDEIRLAHAEMIASLAAGHLTGVHTNVLPDIALYADEASGPVIAEFMQNVSEEGEKVGERLAVRFTRLSVSHEIRRVEGVMGLLPGLVATEARWADLFVASCSPRTESDRDWGRMVEAVMFESGHGLYLIPRGARPRQEICTAMIAWTDTREAARAVSEALPLLTLATNADIVSVQEQKKGRLGGAEAVADIAAHLARHGVNATVTVVPPQEQTAKALLEQAHRISADLIVCGAYGHSRFREWILGGVTQELLQISDVPLLMAH